MSRVIDILTAIQNGQTYDKETYSRAEAILKSIANNTAYEQTALSRYEELLLALKNGEATTLVPMARLETILVAIINGDTVPEEYHSEIEKAFIEASEAFNPIDIEQDNDTLIVNNANAKQKKGVVYL